MKPKSRNEERQFAADLIKSAKKSSLRWFCRCGGSVTVAADENFGSVTVAAADETKSTE